MYTVAINENKLSLGGVCRALSENPAKLYGLYPRKGVIAAGSDADIVVYDPGASHVLHGADMLSKAGYTPFETASRASARMAACRRSTCAVSCRWTAARSLAARWANI